MELLVGQTRTVPILDTINGAPARDRATSRGVTARVEIFEDSAVIQFIVRTDAQASIATKHGDRYGTVGALVGLSVAKKSAQSLRACALH